MVWSLMSFLQVIVHYDVTVDGKRRRRKPKIGDGETGIIEIRNRWRQLHDAITEGRDPVAEDEDLRACAVPSRNAED